MKSLILPVLVTSSAVAFAMAAQQGTPSQGGTPAQSGTPAKQPSPNNSQPRPTNPENANQPPATNPQTPSAPNETPLTRPNDPNAPINQPTQTQPAVTPPNARNAYARPFTFVTPENEPKFLENVRRLDVAERRMTQANDEAIKRLGTIRQLPPDRQNAALFDLLQQMLLERKSLNEYLIDSRTTWTGDLGEANPSATQSQPNAVQQGTTRQATVNPSR